MTADADTDEHAAYAALNAARSAQDASEDRTVLDDTVALARARYREAYRRFHREVIADIDARLWVST